MGILIFSVDKDYLVGQKMLVSQLLNVKDTSETLCDGTTTTSTPEPGGSPAFAAGTECESSSNQPI